MSANYFEGPATEKPVYNLGVIRTPNQGTDGAREIGVPQQLFADLDTPKDIVGGQVAEDFRGLLGAPLKRVVDSTTGAVTYALSVVTAGTPDTFDQVDGVLLLSTDAFDGPRYINVVKGGKIKAWVGNFIGKDADYKTALASALGGKYDVQFDTIKF